MEHRLGAAVAEPLGPDGLARPRREDRAGSERELTERRRADVRTGAGEREGVERLAQTVARRAGRTGEHSGGLAGEGRVGRGNLERVGDGRGIQAADGAVGGEGRDAGVMVVGREVGADNDALQERGVADQAGEIGDRGAEQDPIGRTERTARDGDHRRAALVGVDQAGEGDARGVAARVGEEDRAATIGEVKVGLALGAAGRVGDEVERAAREVERLLQRDRVGRVAGAVIVAAAETGGTEAEARVRVGRRVVEVERASRVDVVVGEGRRETIGAVEEHRAGGDAEEPGAAAGSRGGDGERAGVLVEEVVEGVTHRHDAAGDHRVAGAEQHRALIAVRVARDIEVEGAGERQLRGTGEVIREDLVAADRTEAVRERDAVRAGDDATETLGVANRDGVGDRVGTGEVRVDLEHAVIEGERTRARTQRLHLGEDQGAERQSRPARKSIGRRATNRQRTGRRVQDEITAGRGADGGVQDRVAATGEGD